MLISTIYPSPVSRKTPARETRDACLHFTIGYTECRVTVSAVYLRNANDVQLSYVQLIYSNVIYSVTRTLCNYSNDRRNLYSNAVSELVIGYVLRPVLHYYLYSPYSRITRTNDISLSRYARTFNIQRHIIWLFSVKTKYKIFLKYLSVYVVMHSYI